VTGSLFETVALGMSSDRTSSVLMATSIGLHQPAESIALLVALAKSSLSQSSIIKLLSLFSLVGPVGVLLGSLIKQEASPLVEGALVAATAGTFLYVGATEVGGWVTCSHINIHPPSGES
jgi:solute carrier family 39 (zinc transporter), member 1/2/3